MQISAIFTQKTANSVKFFQKSRRLEKNFPEKAHIWTLFHSLKWKIRGNFFTIFSPGGEKLKFFGRIFAYGGGRWSDQIMTFSLFKLFFLEGFPKGRVQKKNKKKSNLDYFWVWPPPLKVTISFSATRPIFENFWKKV